MAFNRRDFLKVCSGFLTSLAYCCAKPWFAFSAGRPTIRIGVISTLSGFLASFGRGALQAAEIAVKEFNQKGGILGRPVELYILDDSGKAVDVVKGIHQLANQDAVAILGSAVMFQNKDVSQAAESAEIPLF
jgi:ABC-type branched-subunit amino acid transport system substrate-binding protein